MSRKSLLGLGLLLFSLSGLAPVRAQEVREYKATSVSEEDLAKYRDQFLSRVNERRKLGREDKAADREKTPEDLRYDAVLNNAGQWLADLMAKFDDENQPKQLACPHEATKIGGPADMDSPVARIHYFGWPQDDMGQPGAGTEANAARSPNGMEFSGAMFADQLMDTNTHYRPFYAYKLNKIGDHDYQLMGVGIAKSQRGNFFCCTVFGNPPVLPTKFTEESLAALPAQILEKINEYRASQNLEPVTLNDQLTATALAEAKLRAERQGKLDQADEPKTEYQGGTDHIYSYGPQLKDAATFAQCSIAGDSPVMKNPKLKHAGIGLALDEKGTAYITIYGGHP